jgi:hypothetical protein
MKAADGKRQRERSESVGSDETGFGFAPPASRDGPPAFTVPAAGAEQQAGSFCGFVRVHNNENVIAAAKKMDVILGEKEKHGDPLNIRRMNGVYGCAVRAFIVENHKIQMWNQAMKDKMGQNSSRSSTTLLQQSRIVATWTRKL